MKTKVLIISQYYENYSDTDTPYWKPKGGADFSEDISWDQLMYNDENAIKAFKKICKDKSNSMAKYEYLEFKVCNPEHLDIDIDELIKEVENGI